MGRVITIGSLFAGIGGLELGLERSTGGETIWQVELDVWCRGVLARHWPNADRRVRDVRHAGIWTLPYVDVICGGFPCQDISLAGSGAGLAGARSGLWWQFARVVRELRPRVVVVENVSALLARGLGDVLGALAACGYDAEWDCIPAQAVGAPHRRDRLFVVSWRVPDPKRDPVWQQQQRDAGRGDRVPDERKPVTDDVGEFSVADVDTGGCKGERKQGGEPGHEGVADGPRGAAVADDDGIGGQARTLSGGEGAGRAVSIGGGQVLAADRERRQERYLSAVPVGPRRDGERHRWPPGPDDVRAWEALPVDSQPSICGEAHGIPRGVVGPYLAGLGNAVVPQVAEIVGGRVAELLQ